MSETQTRETVALDRLTDRVASLIAFGPLAGTVTGTAGEQWQVLDRAPADGPDYLQQHAHIVGGSANDPQAIVDDLPPETAVILVATPLSTAGGEPLAVLETLQDRDPLTLALVSLPVEGEPAGTDPVAVVDRIRTVADGTVVIPGTTREPALQDVMHALSTIMMEPGLVNVDLADVEAVIGSKSLTAITSGTARSANGEIPPTVAAVDEALGKVPGDNQSATGALLQLSVGAQTSVNEAVAAVDQLRPHLTEDAPIIWGVTIDPYRQSVDANLVLGFEHLPWLNDALTQAGQLDAESPCPRCGGHVASYRLGERERLACDRCGYSGVGLRLR